MPNGSNFLNVNRPDELSTAVELPNTVRRERLKYFPSPIDWRDEVLYFLRPRVFTVARNEQQLGTHRIDTVKYVSLEEARNFCGVIHEFADPLGKGNFPLVGEIAGGDVFQDFYLDRLAVYNATLY